MDNQTIHHLKTWPHLFAAIAEPDPLLRKTVEIRKDDRHFQAGDILVLEEYDVVNGYTGRSIQRIVTLPSRRAVGPAWFRRFIDM